jgi:hydroxypyruvate isomerase
MAELRFDANLKWLFTELDFLDRFDAAAEAGFTGIEYADPYSYKPAELRRRLDDSGLQQILINSPTGASGTPEERGSACLPDGTTQFRDGFERALDYAVELGSQFIHVMAGARPENVSRDRAFARLVTNIGWAAQTARSTDVRIVLEAQNRRDSPRFILQSQSQAAAVAEAIDADNVGIMFDIYHVQVNEGDLITRLGEHLPNAFHLQLADPPGRHEPGTGEIDFPAVFDVIRESSYAGWIGCEYKPLKGTVAGLSWMEKLT